MQDRFFAVLTAVALFVGLFPLQPHVAEAVVPVVEISAEILINPAAVADSLGEYVRIGFTDSGTLDLTGWSFTDAALSVDHTIGAAVLNSGDTWTICAEDDFSLNGGIVCDEEWVGGAVWNNDSDTFTLFNHVGAEIIVIDYTNGADDDAMAYGSISDDVQLGSQDSIQICHSANGKNYVQNAPNVDAFVNLYENDKNGHHDHDYDIIPAFFYNIGGEAGYYPGKNWDVDGQAVWNNSCQDPDGYYGHITLLKEVINEKDADLTVFELTIDGDVYTHGDVVAVEAKKNGATTYTVSETDPSPDYTLMEVSCVGPVDQIATGTTAVDIAVKDGESYTCTITNELYIPDPGSVSGMKWQDMNADGVEDPEDLGLGGWEIELSDVDGLVATTSTVGDGSYSFNDVPVGSYTVCEVNQSGWEQTYPLINNGCHDVTVLEATETTDIDFGNYLIPPRTCEVTLVSDESDYVVEKDDTAKALSFIHSAWTAVIGGATWIWGDDPVVDPANDEIQTFIKKFGFEGSVTKATLYVASDNSHEAELNGSNAGTALEENNFALATQDEYDVTGLIDQGNNMLSVTVKNWGGNSNPKSNPAGLLYKLHIEGEVTTDDDCSIPYDDRGQLIVRKEVVGGDLVASDFAFQVEGESPEVFEVDGENIVTLATGHYDVEEIDIPSNYEVSYDNCENVAVAPDQDVAPVCTITNTYVPPLTCVADVNLIANGSFEEPAITKSWDLVSPIDWIVKKVAGGANTDMEIQRGVNGWLSSEGAQHTELGTTEPVIISQTIGTIPGETYELTWDFSPRPNTTAAENDLDVYVSGENNDNPVASNGGVAGGSQTDWETFSYSFVATDVETTLSFADGGVANSVGTFVDNVIFECVPEVVAPYCGDGVVNQEWEQCDSEEGCAEYCLWENQCHDEQLVKITLDPQAPTSESFDGTINLGAAGNTIPSGTWFKFDVAGDDTVQTIASGAVDGLAVERTATDLRLAVLGENGGGIFDYVFGTIETLGLDMGERNRSVVPVWPLENNGKYRDKWDETSENFLEFKWYLTTGNDAASVALTAGTEYGQCEPVEELYRIQGFVWHDNNENEFWEGHDEELFEEDEDEQEEEEGEEPLAGWTVRITDGERSYSTTTDASGFYYFDVPAGTWTIWQEVEDGWEQITPVDDFEVTVPTPPVEFTLGEKIMNFLVPVAHAQAAIDTYGDYNFGNNETRGGGSSSTGGGGGPKIELTGGGGGSTAGDSDDGPVPTVLGEQVSKIPTGAPNAGAGGAAGRTSGMLHPGSSLMALVGTRRNRYAR